MGQLQTGRKHATGFIPFEIVLNKVEDFEVKGFKPAKVVTKPVGFVWKWGKAGTIEVVTLVDHVTGSTACKTVDCFGKCVDKSLIALEFVPGIPVVSPLLQGVVKPTLEAFKLLKAPSCILEILLFRNIFKVGKAGCDFAKSAMAFVKLLDVVKIVPYARVAAALGTTVPVLNAVVMGLTAGGAVFVIAQSVQNLWKSYKPYTKNKEKRAFWKEGLTVANVEARIEHLQGRLQKMEDQKVAGQIKLWNARKDECEDKDISKYNIFLITKNWLSLSRAKREVNAWERIEANVDKSKDHDKEIQKKCDKLSNYKARGGKIEKWEDIRDRIKFLAEHPVSTVDLETLDDEEKAEVEKIKGIEKRLNDFTVGNRKKWMWNTIILHLDQVKEIATIAGQMLLVACCVSSIVLLFTGYGSLPVVIILAVGGVVSTGIGCTSVIWDFGKTRWLPKKKGHWEIMYA